MGYQTLVWVAKAGVKEVGGKQGFVEVDSDDAKELIKSGLAQDPQIGALHLDEIEKAAPPPPPPPVKKKTAPKRSRATTKKVVKEDELETK